MKNRFLKHFLWNCLQVNTIIPQWWLVSIGSGSMAWCHKATDHYQSQCWLRSMSLYCVTRPQWVKQVVLYLSSGERDLCNAVCLVWMMYCDYYTFALALLMHCSWRCIQITSLYIFSYWNENICFCHSLSHNLNEEMQTFWDVSSHPSYWRLGGGAGWHKWDGSWT